MPAPSSQHIEPLLDLTALQGTIAASSTLTGALTDTASAAGTITATSSLTGATTLTAPLAGTITATASLTGALTNAGPLAVTGAITATATLTGDLTNASDNTLTGTITAASDLAGQLTYAQALAGLIEATCTITGGVETPQPPTTRYAIHWFWEPGNHSEMPDPPKTCPECGAPVVVMTLDLEVFCRHYEADATKTDGTIAETDCPYIATINDSNYAQPLAADILAGYVLTAPV